MAPIREFENLEALKVRFHNAWPALLKDICEDDGMVEVPEVTNWLRTVMKANVLQGKQNRGLACVDFYHHLLQDSKDDDSLALIFGWCTEIWQAAALIADDMMDNSETRRGQICWYRVEDVGLNAINDTLMLENLVYFLIYKYFHSHPCFSRLLSLTHDIGMKTIFGQALDTRQSVNMDFEGCTIEKYKTIVKYKTSFYTFYHPYASAMAIAGITDENLYKKVEDVSVEIGLMFQVQDDYLDCYGNYAITGKIGKDIQDGKCTWLLIQALNHANPEQLNIIKKHYGKKNIQDEKEIRKIYKDLKIQKLFHAFEDTAYRKIITMIQKMAPAIPTTPFINIVQKIYKRNK